MTIAIGVLGGSGLYDLPGLKHLEQQTLTTPFGDPSAPVITGTLDGVNLAFIPRHGLGHRLSPSEVPYRANIWALKSLGVQYVICVSAVGSLKEHYRPLDLVIPDQLVDWTKGRCSTFFGSGLVAHVSFDRPFSDELIALVTQVTAPLDLGSSRVHTGGTYLCMEGPQFSTYAESQLYRSWGMDIIGMTNAQEAKLCREAEIAYVSLCFVTDYDCWHPDHSSVTVEQVVGYLQQNVATAQKILVPLIRRLGEEMPVCQAHSALKYALISERQGVPELTRQNLAPLIQKYLG